MFYALFNSGGVHHRRERAWILTILRGACRSKEGVKIFRR
jgi:hypothetical protein